jgi:hypothetical protein
VELACFPCDVDPGNNDLLAKIVNGGIEEALAGTARVDWDEAFYTRDQVFRLPSWSNPGQQPLRFGLAHKVGGLDSD